MHLRRHDGPAGISALRRSVVPRRHAVGTQGFATPDGSETRPAVYPPDRPLRRAATYTYPCGVRRTYRTWLPVVYRVACHRDVGARWCAARMATWPAPALGEWVAMSGHSRADFTRRVYGTYLGARTPSIVISTWASFPTSPYQVRSPMGSRAICKRISLVPRPSIRIPC